MMIITTVVRRLALYMAQEGATVAKLEQLQASISLPGTLKAIWSLRTFTSRTSAALIIIWGWFYLGSQATTSEYEYRTSGSYHNMQMAYFSPQKPSLFLSEHSDFKVPDVTLSNLNSMYNTFYLGSAKTQYTSQSYDLNGAARIPLLNADITPAYVSFDGYGFVGGTEKKLDRKRHGWYDVTHSPGLPFVSFIGTTIYTWDATYGFVNVNNLEGDYTSNATYFNVTCQATDYFNASAFPKNVNPESLYTINSTDDRDFSTLSTTDSPRSFDVWGRLPDPHKTPVVAHSSCHIRGVPIQMKVHCSTGNCAATRMRFVPGAAQINRTIFDNNNFTSNFFNNLLLSDGIPNDSKYDAYDAVSTVASNLRPAFGALSSMPDRVNLSDVNFTYAQPRSDMYLSFYMTIMTNTYYQASLDPTQGSSIDSTQYNGDAQDIITGTKPSRNYTTGTIKGAIFEPQYRLSIPWVIVDLISCKILLAAAIMAFWLRQNTLAPDIFGYVSSLTRDNPHLNLPEGGSGMSGLERARALKKVKVRIADVADENGVGKVGLRYAGPVDDSGIQMAHLKRDRHYV
jgi:hypothetical protein